MQQNFSTLSHENEYASQRFRTGRVELVELGSFSIEKMECLILYLLIIFQSYLSKDHDNQTANGPKDN